MADTSGQASNLSVVIPTMDRWEILGRTLDGLAGQTVSGFEIIVVVDGTDQHVPATVTEGRQGLTIRVIVQEHAGPGAARNLGAAASDREYVLFLGDDMIPESSLVERHLAAHTAIPEPEIAVLGRVDWHPDVAGRGVQQWMEWSGTQFDYHLIDPGADAGFGRFFSCNVSLDRRFFLDAGGFDPAFIYYYEDLDCGYRLEQAGMRLRYEPAAGAMHLHRYDWSAVQQRFDGIVVGERMMAAKHPWFEPWFLDRLRAAAAAPPVARAWPTLVEFLPAAPVFDGVRRVVRAKADLAYRQRLAPRFLWSWDGYEGLDELKDYLGAGFDEARLHHHQQEVEAEEETSDDEATFYRTSTAYLYDLTAFGLWDTKLPYFEDLRSVLRPGMAILDYGCGIGTDGLRLLTAGHGYRVGFADFDNPSTAYLRWRLERRGLSSPAAELYDLDSGVPGGFDVAYSFDVIEHVDDPVGFLRELEERAAVVAVNFLEPDPDDVHLHKPLPILELLDRAERLGIVRYRRYHGRSHLVIYRGTGPGSGTPGGGVGGRLPRPLPSAAAWLRSRFERRVGASLPGSPR